MKTYSIPSFAIGPDERLTVELERDDRKFPTWRVLLEVDGASARGEISGELLAHAAVPMERVFLDDLRQLIEALRNEEAR